MSTLLAPVRPRAGTDRGIYTYIAVFSAVLYMVLLIAPVIAGKLVQQFGLTPGQVGMLFSFELGAFSLATVPAYLWLRRMNLNTATYLFTAVAIAGNIVSGFLDSFALLVAARVVTSLAAGSITVIILTLSGKTSNPSRAFGIFVVFQLLMGAVILAVFPALFANAGVAAIYWTMAALAACCLPVVRKIDGDILRREPVAGVAGAAGTVPVGKFVAGLAAVLLFYVGLSGVWSFMAQIAGGAGVDLSTVSMVLAIATVPGIISSLLATVLGDSPKRRMFLLAGYVGLAAAVALLFGVSGVLQFAAAAMIFKFAWTFILPYLLSSLADLGGSGHVMNTTNLMIGTGFAIGPALSGVLIETSGGFGSMLAVALACTLASLGCAMTLQRKRAAVPA
ncbi:MFS transporter [Arthrobacter sp. I2-34]|uniref:MFS transporter n=1 Tax=Arthrobacter hankyongi TaxID=2904801 RepID=A0ABS9L1I8_9MICC|nr:MFS transporter [Arthrobacter hankyongi]MCG2620521.1 MFS transporter [Arthrobacter hankyongi]